LGFPEFIYRQLEQRIRAERHHQQQRRGTSPAGMTLKDAYAILSVDANTADRDVKKAYRRLMSQHHPDKLVAKGLPEEMMKVASQKTHEIKQAYEKIKQHRGMK
jgi:DnaJ like chaperone protein